MKVVTSYIFIMFCKQSIIYLYIVVGPLMSLMPKNGNLYNIYYMSITYVYITYNDASISQ
jgi:hypothetical protein